MDNSRKLIVWVVFLGIFLVIYYLQKRQAPTFTESANLALASGGLVTSIALLYSLMMPGIVKRILEKEVGFDVIGFYLGAIAVGWVSLEPIAQLLQPNSFLGIVKDCHVNTDKRFYLELSCKNKRMYRVVITEEILNQTLVNIRNNPNTQTLTNAKGLIGKKITIVDVPPILTGRIHELIVSSPEQLLIR